jgi:hypothetical protein
LSYKNLKNDQPERDPLRTVTQQVYTLVLQSMTRQNGAVPSPADTDSTRKTSSTVSYRVLTSEFFCMFL